MPDDNVTPMHPSAHLDAGRQLENADNLQAMISLDEWLTRLERRTRTLLRMTEMEVPRLVLENQLGLVNAAVIHLNAFIFSVTEPARQAVEVSIAKEIEDHGDLDDIS